MASIAIPVSEEDLQALTERNTLLNSRTHFPGTTAATDSPSASTRALALSPSQLSSSTASPSEKGPGSVSQLQLRGPIPERDRECADGNARSCSLCDEIQLTLAAFCTCTGLYILLYLDSACTTLLCSSSQVLAWICFLGSLLVLLYALTNSTD